MSRDSLDLKDVRSPVVLDVMLKVDRKNFVTERFKNFAYEDTPLPIGYGQTISQPYMVAYMTEQVDLKDDYKVLEIGTGSGYQAAILAEIIESVYTIEINEQLYNRTKKLFENLGYKNIYTKLGDGYLGWSSNSPYDVIMVTCAAESIPPEYVKQLKLGGIICIPVGPLYTVQKLVTAKKVAETELEIISECLVSFVPLVHKKSHKESSL